MPPQVDEHAATELGLFINNDGTLYTQMKSPILEKLEAFKERGTYDHDRAVTAFGYLVEAGAKKYAREFAEVGDWSRIFNAATRRSVAEDLARAFEVEWSVTHKRPASSVKVKNDVDTILAVPGSKSRRSRSR